MYIGINATCLNDRPSGARQRFVGIYAALFRLMPDAQFLIFEPKDTPISRVFKDSDNVISIKTPMPSEGRIERFLKGTFYWPGIFSKKRFEIFEGLHLPFVRPRNSPSILTVHDVRNFIPGWGKLGREISRLILRQSLKKATHIVTVSQTMRSEILQVEDSIPVSVVYNGVDPAPFQSITTEELIAVRQQLGIPQNFLLAVGHLEPRKNYKTLLRALSIERTGIPLVIVGNDSGNLKALQTQIEELHLTRRVHIFSQLSDKVLRCLYKLCDLVIFPSYYEGFGIPLLEAMAAKTPIITSNIAVFQEITQNQGLYFPWNDAAHMAATIERALEDTEERTRLVEFGSRRLEDFSFCQLAQQMKSIYQSLYPN